jgi:diguanylate cyclase (GGDEF)-like protein
MPSASQQVLIVEDSRTYAELLRRRIARHLEFGVLVAPTYADAERLLDEHGDGIFAAVIDLNLPDAPDGEIVDLVLERGISTIVLTSTFDDATREAILAKHVADYVGQESLHDLDYIVRLLRRIERNQRTEVLLVDDSPTSRFLLAQHLLPHKYRVHEAGSGSEALACFEAHPEIRLVITDNKMPGMDGFELVTELRKRASKERLAIIGISAERGGALSAKFLKRGANDFLVKPFSQEEFACRVSQNIELVDLVREVGARANRDYLTGVYNRHYLLDIGDKYFESARRDHLELVVAVIDVDFLRGINDAHGHEAGDEVLKRVAGQLVAELRRTDIVARYDAEQFCVVAVNAGPGYPETFERLRARIAALEVPYAGQSIRVTVSIGATRRLEATLAETLRHAEALVDRAKRDGRDRVVFDQDAQEANESPAAGRGS